MLFLFRGVFGDRYGPLFRAGLGVVFVVVGVVESWKVALVVGGVFIVWGLAAGIGRLTGRGQSSPTGSSGGSLGSSGNERTRFGR